VRAALLVGSDLRHEMPLLNHRLHQAVKKGAKVYSSIRRISISITAGRARRSWRRRPGRCAAGAGQGCRRCGCSAPAALSDAINGAQSDDGDNDAISALKSGKAVVILGEAAVTHPQASWLRAIARFIAEATGRATTSCRSVPMRSVWQSSACAGQWRSGCAGDAGAAAQELTCCMASSRRTISPMALLR
jgi:hypothetical protein